MNLVIIGILLFVVWVGIAISLVIERLISGFGINGSKTKWYHEIIVLPVYLLLIPVMMFAKIREFKKEKKWRNIFK